MTEQKKYVPYIELQYGADKPIIESVYKQVVDIDTYKKGLTPGEKNIFNFYAWHFGKPVHMQQLVDNYLGRNYPDKVDFGGGEMEDLKKVVYSTLNRLKKKLKNEFGIYSIYGTGLTLLSEHINEPPGTDIILTDEDGFRPVPDYIPMAGINKRARTQFHALNEARKLTLAPMHFNRWLLLPKIQSQPYMLLNHLVRADYEHIDTNLEGLNQMIINAGRPAVPDTLSELNVSAVVESARFANVFLWGIDAQCRIRESANHLYLEY